MLLLAPSVGTMKLLQLLLLFLFWAEISIILACYHMELLVFGVLLSPPSGMSRVVLVDASPRAAGPTGAKELAAGLCVTPWTMASGPDRLLLLQGL